MNYNTKAHHQSGTTVELFGVFSVLWAFSSIFHVSGAITKSLQIINTFTLGAMVVCAMALLSQPLSIARLVLLAVAQVVDYVSQMPLGSNHYLITFFLNLTILFVVAHLFFFGQNSLTRQNVYAGFSPVGRYLLLIMYFFGIFHKINADWLDFSVSCGVVLYQNLTKPFGLEDWVIGHYAAVYGTLIVEGLAIILLMTPRLKYYGVLIGIPFHLAIALTGYSWFMDFSAVCLALYSLFFTSEFAERFKSVLRRISPFFDLIKANRTWPIGAVFVVGFVIILIAALLKGSLAPRDLKDIYFTIWMLLFAVYGFLVYVIALFCSFACKVERVPNYWLTHPRLLMIVPFIFVVNGFSPYIGLKTESAIAMYSNLHTEGSMSNHLLIKKPPYFFDYQKHIVRIHFSSDPRLQRLAAKGEELVEFEFWRAVHDNPTMSGEFESDGRPIRLRGAVDEPFFQKPPWVLGKLLLFKPVDFKRPKVCSH